VTHVGVISQILGYLAGESAARWDLFRPGTASITEVCWKKRDSVVVRFDDRRHVALRRARQHQLDE
jgi:broad specificity phosphatase PhoE